MHRIDEFEKIALMIAALMMTVMPTATAATDMPIVDDVAWLAGAWHGEGLGGTFEETWNPPSGRTMVGMFKLMRDDEIVLYEIMRIADVDGVVVLLFD